MASRDAISVLLTSLLLLIQNNISAADYSAIVTCDLDLSEEAQSYLPDQCKQLTQPLKDLAKEESEWFAKWDSDINTYEERHDPNFASENRTIPNKQWEVRERVTEGSSIYKCEKGDDNVRAYYECLIDGRKKMIELLKEEA